MQQKQLPKRLDNQKTTAIIYMKQFLLALACVFALSACKKNEECEAVSPATEEAQILAFCTANGITATKHSSGLYYQVITAGTGGSPSVSSRVYVKYIGKLFNGTVFDQQDNHTLTGWYLGDLIDGWKIGIPLIQKGGKVKLVVPSSLAYGCRGSGDGSIPANTPLYFEVDLVTFQ